MSLNGLIEEFLLERGALKVGFANKETLAGGPPSADLELEPTEPEPESKSSAAISAAEVLRVSRTLSVERVT
ncbi:MAG: hypothetical protein HN580_14890 [Deltaproteobacteria bacterium]|mgnify:FL=1|nr:hypothetical protein [Deltaproteobacteria bacterium]MBT6503482.1 hypothetical protein [Deltaproteobacteria bacterium]MBT7156048.1 hypothetical protein [Deltaproteobacteria bacterium]MBT7890307.1 hypothetical protein [Deltaproteobacteria bacterium]